ncbi:MAG TPA: hypothetical protein VK709_02005 [Candidatus Saccharimonadales bacterium]|nr:hypothetical protein [Candidatus Saccharimonadales bacterium]
MAQIILVVFVFALIAIRGANAGEEHEHLVTDWSHRHLVFSEPHSLMKRFELSRDTRYIQQVRRKNAERRGLDRDEWRWRRALEHPDNLHGDWSVNLGSGATVGAGNYPAKYSFDSTSANCAAPPPGAGQQPDFVVYNTSQPGSNSQATIAAFTNLYSSCTGSPSVYWAYNTGTVGAVVTSPILSFDGSQVAFIQSTPGAATLVILRWAAFSGTLSNPAIPATGGCTALTAPCMTTFALSSSNSDTNPTDTHSSPIYDFPTDTLFVGDAAGFLHKFTGVFLGTPMEVVCTSTTMTDGCTPPAGKNLWPAIVDPGAQLSSPVVLDNFKEVLMTDTSGLLAVVDMTVGGIDDLGSTTTVKLANTGFDDAPLVDVTAGKVYLFARADLATSATAVFQLQVPPFADALDNATGPEVLVSDSGTNPTPAMFNGAFDEAYYDTGGTGNLYACGISGTSNALWQIPISAGVMGTPVLGPSLTTVDGTCSPITEFQNGATDRMFLSVTGNAVTGTPINCSAGSACIMSFDITDPSTWGLSKVTSATTTVTGGTSGIIIDNSSSDVGASQVYFTPLADQACTTTLDTGGCAIQASQEALD